MELEKGQTLIEAVAALAVMLVVVTGMAIVMLTSLDNAQFSKNQNLATQYAQEGVEIMRNVRDTGRYTDLVSLSGEIDNPIKYCLGNNVKITSDLKRKDLTKKGCIAENCTGDDCRPDNIVSFAREVDLVKTVDTGNSTDDCKGSIKVTVITSWVDGKCKDTNNLFCHNISAVSCLTNSTGINAP